MSIRSVKINIDFDQEEIGRLDSLFEQSTCVFNKYAEYCFDNNSFNKFNAHNACYHDIRKLYPQIPSALVQVVGYSAVGAYRGSRKKCKRKIEIRHLKSITYNIRGCDLRGSQLTFSCIGKRIKKIVSVPEWFTDKYDIEKFKIIQLNRSKSGKYSVNFIYKVKSKEKVQTESKKVLGVDRGIYHLAATSDGQFFSGKEHRRQQRKHLYNRRCLQSKGTRSSKRKLKQLSGKEKRFSRNTNNVISKKLVEHCIKEEYNIIALEDLSGIRSKRKGKVLNKRLSSWPFYQLQTMIEYKAELYGIEVKYVDPRYTSQKCAGCGKINPENRKKSKYKCSCGWKCHSDVNASINISNLVSTKVSDTGSCQPAACDDEVC